MSSGLVSKLGLKPSMVLGATMNSLWVLQSLIPAFKYEQRDDPASKDLWYLSENFYLAVNLIISAISGFFGSLLWVAEGTYISSCANEKTKGFFFSYFWMWYMQSQVIGNLVAALLLGSVDQISYFTVMSIFAFTASISFAFLPKPKKIMLTQNLDLSISSTDGDIIQHVDSTSFMTED